jgi:hypothetical protein
MKIKAHNEAKTEELRKFIKELSNTTVIDSNIYFLLSMIQELIEPSFEHIYKLVDNEDFTEAQTELHKLVKEHSYLTSSRTYMYLNNLCFFFRFKNEDPRTYDDND